MTPLVIFGTGYLAELACVMFRQAGQYQPVAFSAEQAFLNQTSFCHLPVVAFESLAQAYAPGEVAICIAAGPHACNGLRERIYHEAVRRGYKLATHVSANACVAADVQVGAGSLVFDGCVIEPFVRLGVNGLFWSGTVVAHHTKVGDHVYCAPRVAISGCCQIGDRCFLGANSTVRDHVKLATATLVGCGAVIQSDTEADSIYPGPKAVRREGRSDAIRL